MFPQYKFGVAHRSTYRAGSVTFKKLTVCEIKDNGNNKIVDDWRQVECVVSLRSTRDVSLFFLWIFAMNLWISNKSWVSPVAGWNVFNIMKDDDFSKFCVLRSMLAKQRTITRPVFTIDFFLSGCTCVNKKGISGVRFFVTIYLF